MNLYDKKIFFTALAFLAVLLKDGKSAKNDTAQINQLAELFQKFCEENVPTAPSLPLINIEEEHGAVVDAEIERHVRELRQNKQTHLSKDREELLRLYDRLQLRKSRRMQRDFYASASAEKLASIVILYIGEEIEDKEGVS